MLQESLENETLNLNNSVVEIKALKHKINDLEQVISTKDEKIQSLSDSLETARCEGEDLSTEFFQMLTWWN